MIAKRIAATLLLLGFALLETHNGHASDLTPFGFAAVCALAALGVAWGTWWGRWLAQGLGVSILATLLARTVMGQIPYAMPIWLFPAGLLALLAGPSMRAYYERKLPIMSWQRAPRWQSESLRWVLIFGVGTIGAVFTYGVGYGFAHYGFATPRVLALGVTVLLLAGVVGLLFQRTVGLLLSIAGGIGLAVIVVHTGQTLAHLHTIGPPTGLCGQAVAIFETAEANLATVVANLLPGLLAIAVATAAHAGAMLRYLR